MSVPPCAGSCGRLSWIPPALRVFLFAFGVKLLFLADSADNPSFLSPLVDADTYWRLAQGLLSGAPLTTYWFWQSPAYPLLLSGLQLLTGGSMWGVKILQALLGSGTCALVYAAGNRFFSRAVGYLAALMTLFYAPLLYYESEFLANALESFTAVSLLLLLCRFQETATTRRAVLLGVVSGFSLFVRPTFIPFVAIALVNLSRILHKEERLTARSSGLLLASFLLAATPFVAARYRVGGDFGIAPYSGGINLYLGNQLQRDVALRLRPGLGWDELRENVRARGHTTHKASARYFLGQTADYVTHNPGHFAKGLAFKSAQFFAGVELPRNEDLYMMREWSVLLKGLLWKTGRFAFPFSVFFPLTLIGLVLASRKVHWSFPLFLLLYAASIVLVFNASRYRSSLIPVAAIFASHGSLSIVDACRRGQLRRLGLLLLALCLGGAATLSGPYLEESIPFQAEFYNFLGTQAFEREELATARRYYERAISHDPRYSDAHYNLGCVHAKADAAAEALEAFERALTLNPTNRQVIVSAYYQRQRLGKSREAEALLETNLALLMGDATMVLEWGRVLLGRGDLPRARAFFERGLLLNPGDSRALQLLKAVESPGWAPARRE